ncbi:hypothetical protein L7F22_033521 [Adiantum nelumboides]|nr:hypothetical protein [Adiantum nelumboides]
MPADAKEGKVVVKEKVSRVRVSASQQKKLKELPSMYCSAQVDDPEASQKVKETLRLFNTYYLRAVQVLFLVLIVFLVLAVKIDSVLVSFTVLFSGDSSSDLVSNCKSAEKLVRDNSSGFVSVIPVLDCDWLAVQVAVLGFGFVWLAFRLLIWFSSSGSVWLAFRLLVWFSSLGCCLRKSLGSNSEHTPINLQPVRQARMRSTHHIGPSALHPMTPSSPAAHTIEVAPLEESDEDPSNMMLESKMNDMVEAIFEATDPTADDMKQEARTALYEGSRISRLKTVLALLNLQASFRTQCHRSKRCLGVYRSRLHKALKSDTQESTPEGTPLAHRRQLPEGYSYLVDASGAIIMTPEGKEVISAMRRLCRPVFRHTVMQTFAAQRQDLKDYVIDTLYHDFPVPTPGDRFGREYMLLRMREYLKHRRDDARRATQRPDWLDKEEWRQIREERVTAPDRWEQQKRTARARIDAGSSHHLGSGGWGSFDEDFQGTTGRAASRLERSLGAQHGLAWVIELLDRRGGESPYTEPLTRAELPDPPQL